ncbi:protein GRAVITROPIC IN THE LIGHT [Trifolium repens]|nr:protein GRAVITROPIC IN THE LIGHT [Trifolium repens]
MQPQIYQNNNNKQQPQISEMFQKFALAFKTKTFEFFADDDEDNNNLDDSDGFSLLDSTEEIITDQKVIIIKPDPNPSTITDSPPKTTPSITTNQLHNETTPSRELLLNETTPTVTPNQLLNETTPSVTPRQLLNETTSHDLISSIFAAVSAFEASYFQLQSAHVPFVEENVKSTDKVLVSQLQRLSEFKKFYCNPNLYTNFPFGSSLEAEVEENQSKLRTLGTVSNRLQLELEQKHDEVFKLRRKLSEIQKGNVNLSKKLCNSNVVNSGLSLGLNLNLNPSCDVLLSVRVFDSLLHDGFRAAHKFTKILIGLMRKAGWDLGLAANAVHPGVVYSKKGHNQYALLSYVCLGMFQGFDSICFGLSSEEKDKEELVSNGDMCDLDLNGRNSCLKQLLEHVSSNPMDLLGIHPGCEFSRFCEMKYERLIHPSMESSIFVDLDQNEAVLNSWRSLSMFYEAFVGMASSIWTLHKLSHTFDPAVEIFQVERGAEFSMVYMDDVTKRLTWPNKGRANVGFTVFPGFRIGNFPLNLSRKMPNCIELLIREDNANISLCT